MRNLHQIISTLSKEEKRFFKIYLHRFENTSGESKAETLFDLVNKQTITNDDHLAQILYPDNKNAYYRLKNRLIEELEKSLLLQHTNLTDRIALTTQICIAKIYLHKKLYSEAFALLKKLEQPALKSEKYELLNLIYSEITEMAIHYNKINLEEWQKKQLINADKYKTRLQTNQIIQNISYRLIKSNFDVRDENISKTLQELQQKLSIDPALINSVRMQFELSQTIRRLLLQKQDFVALESYLTDNYTEFEQKGLYTKDTHPNKIVTLVWIINTLLKNRKFETIAHYAQILHTSLHEHRKMLYDSYIWTYYQAMVVQYFYSGKPAEALQLLSKLSEEKSQKTELFHSFFVHGNLSAIHYCQGQLQKAMNSLKPLLIKDVFNRLSVELQLRLSILEIMLHFDNSDFAFIDYRITDMRSTFKALLENPQYKREKDFLGLLKKCAGTAQPFKNLVVINTVQQFIDQSPPFAPGSNEFISYRIWLESKVKQQPYYRLILAAVV